jgi:hypothetical protein
MFSLWQSSVVIAKLVSYHNNAILSSSSVKFLATVIENSCTWKAHISQLMPKLCNACYWMRVIKPIMASATLKMAYYAYLHSLLSTESFSGAIPIIVCTFFKFKKIIIRVKSELRPKDACWDAVRDWGILPSQSQYIFSLSIFVGNNTRRKFDLYHPQANLTIYQRGPYYFGTKFFNSLPLNIKELAHNVKQFRVPLCTFLHSKSF